MKPKLTPGMVAALHWLKEQPALLLPHTVNYYDVWEKHKPASVASFFALERKGLAFRKDPLGTSGFWYLTPEGEQVLAELTCKNP